MPPPIDLGVPITPVASAPATTAGSDALASLLGLIEAERAERAAERAEQRRRDELREEENRREREAIALEARRAAERAEGLQAQMYEHRRREVEIDFHREERRAEERRTAQPEKLRTDGIPKWPAEPGIVYPFFVFAEDFIVWLSMIGYDEVIQTDPDDVSGVSEKADNMALRYLCAAMTNQTISTHLADAFKRRGRAAWRYLNKEFGLPSLKQTQLRADLDKLQISTRDDPRLLVMLFDRIVKRLSPAPPAKEKAELLLLKMPPQYNDIASIIRNSAAMDCDDASVNYDNNERGVRGKFITLVNERRTATTTQRRDMTRVNALSVGDPATEPAHAGRGAGRRDTRKEPAQLGPVERENERLRRQLQGANRAAGNRPISRGFGKGRGGRGNNADRGGPRPMSAASANQQGGGKGQGPKMPGSYGTARADAECHNCGEKGHYARDCPKPKVKCRHPKCGKNHLDRYCFWQHPEKIQNPQLREQWQRRVAAYNTSGDAAFTLSTGAPNQRRTSSDSASVFMFHYEPGPDDLDSSDGDLRRTPQQRAADRRRDRDSARKRKVREAIAYTVDTADIPEGLEYDSDLDEAEMRSAGWCPSSDDEPPRSYVRPSVWSRRRRRRTARMPTNSLDPDSEGTDDDTPVLVSSDAEVRWLAACPSQAMRVMPS